MRSRRSFLWSLSMLVAASVGIGALSGCGSSSSGATPSEGPVITRETDAGFSMDAKVLAARVADANGDTWLSATFAAQADADLKLIRAQYPAVQGIDAQATYDLHTVIVEVKNSVSWAAHWTAGAPTGERQLDALLAEFAPSQITPFATFAANGTTDFTLTFPQSLNMRRVAAQFTTASTNITGSNPNYYAFPASGFDSDITTTTESNGARDYVFRQGVGNLPSVNFQEWDFTVSTDGKTVTQTKDVSSPGPATSAS